MSKGSKIAAKIAKGLAKAAKATGDGPVTGYIIKAGAPTGPAHNPTPGVETQSAVTALYGTWKAGQIDGTLIRATDQRITVDATGVVPETGDRFWNGVDMNGAEKVTGAIVAPLTRLAPGGVALSYVLNVRY